MPIDSKDRLADFILEAAHAGMLDVFEAWRTMAACRAVAIAEGRDPATVRFTWRVTAEPL